MGLRRTTAIPSAPVMVHSPLPAAHTPLVAGPGALPLIYGMARYSTSVKTVI